MLQVHNRWTSTTVPHGFVSFFVCKIEKLVVWCISVKKNYDNLTKNDHKFQASVTETCTSLSKSSEIFWRNPSKFPMKKLNLYQWLFIFPVRFFSPIYRSRFVSYVTDIFCIRIYICKKYFFPFLLFLRSHAKEK